MGISIGNCRQSIDMPYSGFYKLRNKVADLLNEDFSKLYHEYVSLSPTISDKEANDRLEKLYVENKLTENDNDILDFLFQPEYKGKLNYKGCRKLFNLIKDYDDNILYGYAGRSDCAMFKDFKKIVYECYSNRIILKWN